MAKNITKTIKTVNVIGFAIDTDTMQVAPAVSFDIIGGISERKALKLAKTENATVVAVKLQETENRYRMPVSVFVENATIVTDENDDENDDENIF